MLIILKISFFFKKVRNMGCVDSKLSSSGGSESVEITSVNAPLPSTPSGSGLKSVHSSADHVDTSTLSPKQRLALAKAKATADDVHNPAHPSDATVDNNSSDEEVDDQAPAPPQPKAPPTPIMAELAPPISPLSSSASRDSPAAPEKKLKMSEILQAERVKKTITSSTFSGEVSEVYIRLDVSMHLYLAGEGRLAL